MNFTAPEWSLPSATEITSSIILTGVQRSSWVPSPSWPRLLLPHVQREPSEVMAAECSPPSATKATPSIILTGVQRSSWVPSPSWPRLLLPHVQREPSEVMAAECSPPSATATTALVVTSGDDSAANALGTLAPGDGVIKFATASLAASAPSTSESPVSGCVMGTDSTLSALASIAWSPSSSM